MPNGNGNGNVTVRLREKAEKILLSKYERAVRAIRDRYEALNKKVRNQVLTELGLDKLIKKFKSLRKEIDDLEQGIRDLAGRGMGYYSASDIERGEIHGDKVQKAIEKHMKSGMSLDSELKRLEELKDQLLEELWLAGQPDEVKAVLAKMK